VDGVRLEATTPHFGKVYGFDPNLRARDSVYSGHILEPDSRWLRTSEDKLKVREKRYAVFGDNTVNSLDSRYWGDLPERNLMGRAWIVYWPCSTRFGFAIGR
jgi:signal peptidase I